DGTVKLWDVESGKELKTFVHPKDVNGVAVSRDGKWLLTGCDDYTVRLWDLKSGQEVRRYTGHSGYAYGVAVSPDMKHIASGSADRTVLIHDFATGNKLREITGPANYTNSVAFSSDNRYVFACGDSVPRMWEVDSGKDVRRFEGSSPDVANALAL